LSLSFEQGFKASGVASIVAHLLSLSNTPVSYAQSTRRLCDAFLFQIADFRLQISDSRFQISDFRFQIADFRFQIADNFRFQI